MPEIADAVQLRILTHYAAGTELSSIAVIVGVGYDEVVDVINTLTGFDRSRAAALIRNTDRPRLTAPVPAKRQRIEFKLPPVEEPKPPAPEVVQAEPSAQVIPPTDGGREEPQPTVEASTTPAPARVRRRPPPRPASLRRRQEPVEVPPVPLPGPERLAWWDAFQCLVCHSRSFLPHDCCGRATTPVTVTVTVREVSR